MAPPFDQIFPPTPTFVQRDADDQSGRVFLVTGSTSGIGLELAKMLYGLNGTVYIAARSKAKIDAATKTIESQVRTKTGRVEGLQLDLANLSSIGDSARDFLAREDRLDVLVHNAGLMTPPAGSKTNLVSKCAPNVFDVVAFYRKSCLTYRLRLSLTNTMVGARSRDGY